uniref:Jacalin-type lectin domain-containing protein n=1 Tax=Quercus lobata TaxID=97700 RepID=A0A7N2KSA7_QUELO
MEENLKVGPWGGEGGKNSWSFKANKGGISEIVIMHGWAIDAISFKSDDRSGTFQYSDKFGGNGGRTEKIMLDWPREYLTSISGTYESAWPFGPVVIKSLHIITNVTKYGPYGYENGTPFSFPAEGGEIVGFHGRSEDLVHSIGVYVKSQIPFCASNPDYTMQQEIKLDASTEFLVGIMGFYGPVKGNDDYEALRSITLYTKNGRYGPFGEEIGTSFTSSASRGKVVGSHGRKWYLFRCNWRSYGILLNL